MCIECTWPRSHYWCYHTIDRYQAKGSVDVFGTSRLCPTQKSESDCTMFPCILYVQVQRKDTVRRILADLFVGNSWQPLQSINHRLPLSAFTIHLHSSCYRFLLIKVDQRYWLNSATGEKIARLIKKLVW